MNYEGAVHVIICNNVITGQQRPRPRQKGPTDETVTAGDAVDFGSDATESIDVEL